MLDSSYSKVLRQSSLDVFGVRSKEKTKDYE